MVPPCWSILNLIFFGELSLVECEFDFVFDVLEFHDIVEDASDVFIELFFVFLEDGAVSEG